MNVLQRIANLLLPRVVHLRLHPHEARSRFWLCGAILVLYFILMKFVPVPGYGAGVLEPVGNWGNYIDQLLISGHMQHPHWEGKSLLGSFPALVTMLMGLLTGVYLRTRAAGLRETDQPVFLRQLLDSCRRHLEPLVPHQPRTLDQFAGAFDGRNRAAVSGHLLLRRGY